MKSVRRLGRFARGHRRRLASGVLGALLLVVCQLAAPWPLRGLLELAFSERDSTVLDLVPPHGDPEFWLVGAFAAIVCGGALGDRLQRASFKRFSIGLAEGARSAALESITSAERAHGQSSDGENRIARVIDDSARLRAGLERALIDMTSGGAFFVGACILLLAIDARLGLLLLAGGVAAMSLNLFGALQARGGAPRLPLRERRLSGTVHRLGVRSGHGEPDNIDTHNRSDRASAMPTKRERLLTWMVQGVLGATSGTIALLGIYLVRTDALAPGDLFVVIVYLLALHFPAVRLSHATLRSAALLESAEHLVDATGPVRGRRDRRPVPLAAKR
jgi:ABC-type multidrug transport system fused ATPase/permease subunit